MSDAVTAAHDKAWKPLFALICSHLAPEWQVWRDEFVGKTDIPCDSLTTLKPDGLLWNPEEGIIEVLEFKRTNDFFPDSFKKGFLKKWIKYKPLVTALEAANPGCKVRLSVFTLGDRGLHDEARWAENWSKMDLPPKGLYPFCVKAALLAQEVATDILAVYSGVLKNLSPRSS
jgi:hypothetical protein